MKTNCHQGYECIIIKNAQSRKKMSMNVSLLCSEWSVCKNVLSLVRAAGCRLGLSVVGYIC